MKYKNKFYFDRRGFTLIELLAVIVILAIVLVVTIPSIINSMSAARSGQLKNATDTVSEWLTKKYDMYRIGLDLSSDDQVYLNFTNKMGDFPISYGNAKVSSKDLSSCGNSNNIYCKDESLAMLKAAGISDPEENIDLTNSYIWVTEDNKIGVKLTAKENGIFYNNDGDNYALSNTSNQLPHEYEEVECLIAANNGYVNTGIELTSTDIVRLRIFTGENTSAACLFGSYSGTSANNNYSIYSQYSKNSIIRYGSGKYSAWKLAANTEYIIEMSGIGLKVNGEELATWSTGNFETSSTTFIGHINGSSSSEFTGKLCEFEIVGKFKGVPCKRNSDGKVGYYDLITHNFFEVEGTWTADN